MNLFGTLFDLGSEVDLFDLPGGGNLFALATILDPPGIDAGTRGHIQPGIQAGISAGA